MWRSVRREWVWALTRRTVTSRTGGTGAAPAARPHAVPVTAARAVARDTPLTLTSLGAALSWNSVTILSQASGKLIRVNFVEGSEVKAGQQTEVVGGVVGAPTTVTANALIEDRPANIWDAFLRWINQLVDTIAKALARE